MKQENQRRAVEELDPKALCLCGSGSRFQNCCKGRLPGFNNDKRWREAAHDKRWGEMIRHLRADVTQYSIWHLKHTAPSIRHNPELRAGWLMKTDIEALSDFVENLMWDTPGKAGFTNSRTYLIG